MLTFMVLFVEKPTIKRKKEQEKWDCFRGTRKSATGALARPEHGVLASRGESIQRQGLESQDQGA